MVKDQGILAKLASFSLGLKQYEAYRIIYANKGLKQQEYREMMSLRERLNREVGRFGSLITELTGKEKIHTVGKGPEYDYDMWGASLRIKFDKTTLNSLRICIDYTDRAIGKLESDINEGMRDKQGRLIGKPSRTDTEPPKAFIAHGGKSEARDKLHRFLTALGVIPFIIEEEPKEGRSVNEQVEYYSEQADCAIILGTADDKELKDGKLYPRRNVYIEIGRFQKEFPNRIIYLLEEGASFPSNISEKLYTRFTQESMDEAFITVARELKAFGLLQTVKPQLKEQT